LLKDNFYVIKVIDVAKVPQEIGLEALKEIEMMGGIDSPYIVGYFDSFIDDQKINLVIEYCPNGDLNSVIEKQKLLGKPLIDNLIWKIFIHLCLGLQYLHHKNIIHRDLKSLNIFMVKENIAKIGDLGCAITLPDVPEEAKKSIVEDIDTPKDDNPFDIGADEEDLLDDELLSGNFKGDQEQAQGQE